jgi:hypothetical protein
VELSQQTEYRGIYIMKMWVIILPFLSRPLLLLLPTTTAMTKHVRLCLPNEKNWYNKG